MEGMADSELDTCCCCNTLATRSIWSMECRTCCPMDAWTMGQIWLYLVIIQTRYYTKEKHEIAWDKIMKKEGSIDGMFDRPCSVRFVSRQSNPNHWTYVVWAFSGPCWRTSAWMSPNFWRSICWLARRRDLLSEEEEEAVMVVKNKFGKALAFLERAFFIFVPMPQIGRFYKITLEWGSVNIHWLD